jgi:hypothetical protein
MPILLRTVRQNRWIKADAEPFLHVNDVPADPLPDLNTQSNLLSVWEVAPDRSNLERIVRAVALTRHEIANMGYVLFDSAVLPAAGIETVNNIGGTPDEGANAWHRDLVVSGRRLVELTKAIFEHGESGAVLKVRLRQLVEDGIERNELPEKCREKLKGGDGKRASA